MKKTIVLFFLFAIAYSLLPCFSQNQHKIDSLENEIKKLTSTGSTTDTTIAKLYNKISGMYWGNNPAKAMQNAQKCLDVSQKIDYKKGMAWAYTSMGVINEDKGNYPIALTFYVKALKISELINDKKGIASGHGNIGNIYNYQGDYPNAITQYHQALKIYTETNDQSSIANQYSNLGSIYFKQSNYSDAYDNLLKSLEYMEKTGDKFGIADSYFNIGNIFMVQKKLKDALSNFTSALKIYEQVNDKTGTSLCNSAIGGIYFEQGNYEDALKNYSKSLISYKETGDKNGISSSYFSMGKVFSKSGDYAAAKLNLNFSLIIRLEIGDKRGASQCYNYMATVNKLQGNYKDAIINANKALALAQEIGSKDLIKDAYSNLLDINSKTGNYKDAFDYQTMYHAMNDSIYNDETKNKLTELKLNYEYKQKETIAKAEQEKKDVLAREEIQRQKNLRNSLFGGFALMIVLAGVSFRSYRRKQKDNLIITKQKELVEDKNKEITKSIEYALRIQSAILPPTRLIKQHFPESFIVYKPKDIVAGDFYWMEELNSKFQISNSEQQSEISNLKSEIILLAACDCTGHGVPGAMVSVVCHNALNRAVREFGLTKPSDILDKTEDIVVENFSKSEDNIQDGMDISMVCLTPTLSKGEGAGSFQLQYAGANNALWIVRKTPLSFGEGSGVRLEETKADKQPIGKNENSFPFTNHTFELNQGDSFYLFTDGYADQFGGESGEKKLTRKKFKELILSIQNKTMQEQGIALDTFITNYRKQVEQIDDILVMGVRI